MLVPLNYSHWYGPGLMGACVSTVALDDDLTMRAEVRMGVENTVDPTEHLNLLKGNKMQVANAVAPADDLILRANTGMALVSKVNELTQDDVTGAVLSAELMPGLTFRQALIDARSAAKLAAALSA